MMVKKKTSGERVPHLSRDSIEINSVCWIVFWPKLRATQSPDAALLSRSICNAETLSPC